MTTGTDRIQAIFEDARVLQADALEMLALGKIRNAAEKAWGATRRATVALVLARTGGGSRNWLGRRPTGCCTSTLKTRRCGGYDCWPATSPGKDTFTAGVSTTAAAARPTRRSAGYGRRRTTSMTPSAWRRKSTMRKLIALEAASMLITLALTAHASPH